MVPPRLLLVLSTFGLYLGSFLLFLGSAQAQNASDTCVVVGNSGRPIRNTDALSNLLQQTRPCPRDVFDLRTALKNAGYQIAPHLVANRGFFNPGLGSFSVFESVTGGDNGPSVKGGEFFFGHFTAAAGRNLVADQTPRSGGLMIELIVWDTRKNLFNFYELIGTGRGSQWFYRGDTRDILIDNNDIFLGPAGEKPKIGQTLRCSGCHSAGGPILKELEFPHNDWWSKARPLPIGGRQPEPRLEEIFRDLEDTQVLASQVKSGMMQLETSFSFQKLRSQAPLPLALKPLFCTTEINIVSSRVPFASTGQRRGSFDLEVPVSFFVNPLLVGVDERRPVFLKASASAYTESLFALGAKFPEINRIDADHPWLTPVKSTTDLQAIRSLVVTRRVDSEFVADVLAVDGAQPMFSQARCDLIKLVPSASSRDWQRQFLKNLQTSTAPAARELAENLTNPVRTQRFHLQKARAFLRACQTQLAQTGTMKSFVRLLDQRRREVFASEISMNPRGQILEPGFRVIFPELAQGALTARTRGVTAATREAGVALTEVQNLELDENCIVR